MSADCSLALVPFQKRMSAKPGSTPHKNWKNILYPTLYLSPLLPRILFQRHPRLPLWTVFDIDSKFVCGAQAVVEPITGAAMALPPAALRADMGALLTVTRFLPSVISTMIQAGPAGQAGGWGLGAGEGRWGASECEDGQN